MKHPALGQNGSQSRRPNALPTQKRRNNTRKKWDFCFGKGIGNQRVSTNAAHPPSAIVLEWPCVLNLNIADQAKEWLNNGSQNNLSR
jgi:hypothetical protein